MRKTALFLPHIYCVFVVILFGGSGCVCTAAEAVDPELKFAEERVASIKAAMSRSTEEFEKAIQSSEGLEDFMPALKDLVPDGAERSRLVANALSYANSVRTLYSDVDKALSKSEEEKKKALDDIKARFLSGFESGSEAYEDRLAEFNRAARGDESHRTGRTQLFARSLNASLKDKFGEDLWSKGSLLGTMRTSKASAYQGRPITSEGLGLGEQDIQTARRINEHITSLVAVHDKEFGEVVLGEAEKFLKYKELASSRPDTPEGLLSRSLSWLKRLVSKGRRPSLPDIGTGSPQVKPSRRWSMPTPSQIAQEAAEGIRQRAADVKKAAEAEQKSKAGEEGEQKGRQTVEQAARQAFRKAQRGTRQRKSARQFLKHVTRKH